MAEEAFCSTAISHIIPWSVGPFVKLFNEAKENSDLTSAVVVIKSYLASACHKMIIMKT